MRDNEERRFHLLMGGIFIASIVFDRAARSALPQWNPPSITLISLVVGLVWVGRYAACRIDQAQDSVRTLRDRLDALEDWKRAEERRAAMARRPQDGPLP